MRHAAGCSLGCTSSNASPPRRPDGSHVVLSDCRGCARSRPHHGDACQIEARGLSFAPENRTQLPAARSATPTCINSGHCLLLAYGPGRGHRLDRDLRCEEAASQPRFPFDKAIGMGRRRWPRLLIIRAGELEGLRCTASCSCARLRVASPLPRWSMQHVLTSSITARTRRHAALFDATHAMK
eukprot:364871-Chlamydomonas_euryale.AAC.7